MNEEHSTCVDCKLGPPMVALFTVAGTQDGFAFLDVLCEACLARRRSSEREYTERKLREWLSEQE